MNNIYKNIIKKFSSSKLIAFVVILFISLISISLYANNTYKGKDVKLGIYSNFGEDQKKLNNEFVLSKSDINSSSADESISIDKIFDGVINKNNTWVLTVTGDIMLGRTVNTKTIKYNDFDWVFKNISDLFRDGDITFVNLESPLVSNCKPTDSGMIFCGDINHVSGIKNAGIDIVSFANNHALNQGVKGVNETVSELNDANIMVTGVNNPNYYEYQDIKIAFLAYDDVECYKGIECADEENIIGDLSEAERNSDLIIIMFSWGNEYTYIPTSRQQMLAHLAIDNGADLVLGNHPHWYQPLEIYKDRLIMYSHGNTVFDQMWSKETREGLIGKYYFDSVNLVDAEFIPIIIYDYGQPDIADHENKDAILRNFYKISTR